MAKLPLLIENYPGLPAEISMAQTNITPALENIVFHPGFIKPVYISDDGQDIFGILFAVASDLPNHWRSKILILPEVHDHAEGEICFIANGVEYVPFCGQYRLDLDVVD